MHPYSCAFVWWLVGPVGPHHRTFGGKLPPPLVPVRGLALFCLFSGCFAAAVFHPFSGPLVPTVCVRGSLYLERDVCVCACVSVRLEEDQLAVLLAPVASRSVA